MLGSGESWYARCCADVLHYPPAPPLVVLTAPFGLSVVSQECTQLSIAGRRPSAATTTRTLRSRGPPPRGRPPDASAAQLHAQHVTEVSGLTPGAKYTLGWRRATRRASARGAKALGHDDAVDGDAGAPRAADLRRLAQLLGDRVELPPMRRSGCTAHGSLALRARSPRADGMMPSWQTVRTVEAARAAHRRRLRLNANVAYSLRLLAVNAPAVGADVALGPVAVGDLESQQGAARQGDEPRTLVVEWGHLAGRCQPAAR